VECKKGEILTLSNYGMSIPQCYRDVHAFYPRWLQNKI